MIERVQILPSVPPTREERRLRFRGSVENAVPADELALKRKHGRSLQARFSAELLAAQRRREYEAEAIATAHTVTQEDYKNANS